LATAAGGTTPLMMAAPDAHKIRTLIERGADVNARSSRGYTALMAAARYRQSDAAISLLLGRGAPAARDGGERRDGTSVLGIAAHAGNTRALPRPRQLGEDVAEPIRLGSNLLSPMALAIRNGNAKVVEAQLDLGADVNRIEGDIWSTVERAVFNNDLTIARLLVRRGATSTSATAPATDP
jgi:uncharacterized protein